MKFILSDEVKMEYLRKEFKEQLDFEYELKYKKHFVGKEEEFYFLKEENVLIDASDFPQVLPGMQSVKNSNFYEVKVFSINNHSELPICYTPTPGTSLDVYDYRNATTSSSVVLA